MVAHLSRALDVLETEGVRFSDGGVHLQHTAPTGTVHHSEGVAAWPQKSGSINCWTMSSLASTPLPPRSAGQRTTNSSRLHLHCSRWRDRWLTKIEDGDLRQAVKKFPGARRDPEVPSGYLNWLANTRARAERAFP
jgi:hypothetical protein